MAYLVAIIEPDDAKRARFVASARATAASFTSLHLDIVEQDSFAAVIGLPWAGCLKRVQSPGGVSLLAGQATDARGRRMDVREIASIWTDGSTSAPRNPDGYFFALDWRNGRLVAMVDPIGLYPFYHTRLPGGSFLVASAPGFLHAHPDFQFEPDREGMAGLLLVNGLLFNRTIARGVKQLAAGHLLVVDARGAREVSALPPASPAVRWTYRQAVDAVREVWLDAVRAAMPPDDHPEDCLLSGGRDSRMIAASIINEGRHPRLVTLGADGDYEVAAAGMVARRLGSPEQIRFGDADPGDYLDHFHHRVFSGMYAGGTLGGLAMRDKDERSLRPYLWSGMVQDDVVGGCGTSFVINLDTGDKSMADFLRKLNRWGWPLDTLANLLGGPDARDLVQSLTSRFIQGFGGEDWNLDMQGYETKLRTRARYHLGSALWRLSFYSWPLVAVCHHRLVDLTRSLPLEYVAKRRLQFDLIRALDPGLLRIPHDINMDSFASHSLRWLWPKWRQRRYASDQPLRYHRVYGQNHPGWVAIRREAEESRDALSGWFDMDLLRERWPEWPRPLPGQNPFAPMAGARTLMGLACAIRTGLRPVTAT